MAAGFSNLAYYFQTFGVLDFLLPFILVFTIVYAVMQRTKILGDNKNFNVVIALVMALSFVIPHVIGWYPLGYDPVQVLNEAIPSISLVAVAAIMLLILLGLFGRDVGEKLMPVIAIAAITFVIYIFGSTSTLNVWQGPSEIFSWWTPETTELMLVILVFGLVVWFITKEPNKPGDKTALGGVSEFLKGLTEKRK
jgi:hypothetical protein